VQSLCPVRQPAVPGPQGLGERVESVALLLELAELSAHLIEGAVPVAGAELQPLSPADKNQLASRRKDKRENNGARKKTTSKRTSTHLEDTPRRAAMNPQRLVQCPVERGAVAAELLPQLLLLLGLGEVGGASTRSSPEAGGAARDEEASAPCPGPRPPCGHPTFSQALPPGARGLAWAGLPTGPTRAAGRRHRGSPPPSPGSYR
jgi:hypothetical protein